VLAAWDARRREEAALTNAIRTQLPRQLAARVRAACTQREILEIVADSGAVAAAVRQRLGAVHERLLRDGHEFSGIKVRVQVRADAPIPGKTPLDLKDNLPTASLARLARSIAPGPLRTSLERLLKRGR
jgi:hypothetical protein